MTDYTNWTSEDFEAVLAQSSFLSQHEARALLDRHVALEKELVETVANRMRSLERELALGARVAELEAWIAAIREAAHGGDVSKNVIIMTGRALSKEPADDRSLGLLRAYRARVPQSAAGTGEESAPGSSPAGSVGASDPQGATQRHGEGKEEG